MKDNGPSRNQELVAGEEEESGIFSYGFIYGGGLGGLGGIGGGRSEKIGEDGKRTR